MTRKLTRERCANNLEGRDILAMLKLLQILVLAFAVCVSCCAAEPLRVLQFNVWQEGTSVENGFEKICNVIIASKAHVVCFSEVRNYKDIDWTTRVVEALARKNQKFYGKFGGGDVGLVSVFPIEETKVVYDATKGDSGSIVAWRLKRLTGERLIVASAHLDYKHYGLNLIRGYNGGDPDWKIREADANGKPVPLTDAAAVLAFNNRSKRVEAIQSFLKSALEWENRNLPVVLCGDFNEGSHLDWTALAKNEFGHNGVVIEWPCTRLLAEAGFADAWRAIHADEVKRPGFTWPAPVPGKKSTSWANKSDERDRIDFIFAKGLKATGAWVVGPKKTICRDEPAADPDADSILLDELPWPSDHKAVLIQF